MLRVQGDASRVLIAMQRAGLPAAVALTKHTKPGGFSRSPPKTGVLAANLISHGMIAAILALLTVQGLALAVVNLIPTGSHPDRWSDGRWVRAA